MITTSPSRAPLSTSPSLRVSVSPLAATPVVLALLMPSVATPAEMKEEVKFDRSNSLGLRTMFGTYGYHPKQSVLREVEGLRFRLPAGTSGVTQTGAYSYFALAGDCEVTLVYELLNLQPPEKGYGTSVGLAFDAADSVSRGEIQRVHKKAEGNGYFLQSALASKGGKMKKESKFLATTSKRGGIGLRRIGKELVFLASDSPTAPPEEIGRMPFTDRTIRIARLFADPGGSPTAIDARVKEIKVRAEEITGGVPQRVENATNWLWLWGAVPVAGVGLLFWRWRVRRRRPYDEKLAVNRKPRLKRA